MVDFLYGFLRCSCWRCLQLWHSRRGIFKWNFLWLAYWLVSFSHKIMTMWQCSWSNHKQLAYSFGIWTHANDSLHAKNKYHMISHMKPKRMEPEYFFLKFLATGQRSPHETGWGGRHQQIYCLCCRLYGCDVACLLTQKWGSWCFVGVVPHLPIGHFEGFAKATSALIGLVI